MSAMGLNYQDYINSQEWRSRRAAALRWADHKCQVCYGTKQLDVHHRTYDRLGYEDPSDLTVLCRECHDLFHGRIAATPIDRASDVERLFLWTLIRNPGSVDIVRDLVSPDELTDPVCQEGYTRCLMGDWWSDPDNWDTPIAGTPELNQLADDLRSDLQLEDPVRSLWEAIQSIKLRPLLDRLDEVAELLKRRGGDRTALRQEQAALKQRLRDEVPEWNTRYLALLRTATRQRSIG